MGTAPWLRTATPIWAAAAVVVVAGAHGSNITGDVILTADSGAGETVMPRDMCEDFPTHESPGSRRGKHYEVANGHTIKKLGEKRLTMMTEGSMRAKGIKLQVCDVHRSLLSLSKAADAGFETFLGKEGGWLRDAQTGERVPLHRRGNLYIMKAWVKPSAGFAGPE